MTDALAGRPIEVRPLHELTERWRASLRPPITLPCVCDGPEIRSYSNLAADIAEAIQRHQVEPVHIAWDRAHGIPLAAWQLTAAAVDGER